MDGLLRSVIKTVRRRLRADEEITVEAVTKELGYTRQYVSGRFHRTTGRLLSHFLKEKRLEKAARLLKAPQPVRIGPLGDRHLRRARSRVAQSCRESGRLASGDGHGADARPGRHVKCPQR